MKQGTCEVRKWCA